MMLVDTDVLIRHLRGYPNATRGSMNSVRSNSRQ
jgi:predicted nucleic acid-binding protein